MGSKAMLTTDSSPSGGKSGSMLLPMFMNTWRAADGSAASAVDKCSVGMVGSHGIEVDARPDRAEMSVPSIHRSERLPEI